MLFNSYEFIFLFLPVVLLVFHLIGNKGQYRIAVAWLIGASLFFYGWWNPVYLGLILFSILFNYSIGVSLSNSSFNKLSKQMIISLGVIANLSVLGYYKYANFFVENLNALSSTNLIHQEVILPLAISFFTFQQIAYLVDTYRGNTKEYNFLHYCLFVTFFPQLIAGPIVHHKEMMPQFAKNYVYKLSSKHLAIGLTIFALGLFKKVLLADGISFYSTQVFDAAQAGEVITFFAAWGGAFAYTFQLYFDFSGYSDMAIGIARMFGILLPLNFNSPYKAMSIIDFWRRWHITLSRFLKDYLYVPLGGGKNGNIRRHVNVMITMVLGGLWHGADWTFVLWGALHGCYLIINHSWRLIFTKRPNNNVYKFLAWTVTFLAVVVAWVPFRAESIVGAGNLITAMVGLNGFALPESYLWRFNYIFGLGDYLVSIGCQFGRAPAYFYGIREFMAIIFLLLISIILPNTKQIMRLYRPAFVTYHGDISHLHFRWMEWRPTLSWAIIIGLILVLGILGLTQVSEFLYFQF
jgi:alginate O-acetyltransferase complex protein AlgI